MPKRENLFDYTFRLPNGIRVDGTAYREHPSVPGLPVAPIVETAGEETNGPSVRKCGQRRSVSGTLALGGKRKAS